MKNNGGFLAILLLGAALLAALWLRCIGSSYREGLGELKIGTGVVLLGAISVVGLIVFLLLIIATIQQRKTNSLKLNLLKTVVSVGVLVLSTPVALLVLPGEPGYRQYTKGFLARVDRECDETAIRRWASNFMASRSAGPQRDSVTDPASIPDFIRRIYPFEQEPEFRWSVKEENGQKCLSIYWGGALPGHWGLEIGQPDFTRTSSDNLYVIEWKPGIYVWHGIDW